MKRAAALALVLALAAPGARAQSAPVTPPPVPLLSRVGVDAASRLMRSSDPDERLRGIERAAATHTNDARLLLERAAGIGAAGGVDPRMPQERLARGDPRALLAAVRGLADWTDRESARVALASIVRDPAEALATHPGAPTAPDPAADDATAADRVLLARQQAAIALAGSGNALAVDGLVAIARSGGPGQSAALDALALVPPDVATTLGGVTLTTPAMIALATSMGDLRAVDAVLGATGVSDPALRAAALMAMGAAGDTRAIPIARAAQHDDDARVRVAAAETLVRLSATDGAAAVEALVADDATALEGLRLARDAQGEGVTKAAAARALASDDPALRAAAVEALGRQTTPAAVTALVALSADRLLAGDVAAALARSPSAGAAAALDGLARANPNPNGEMRRLAARAYFVRRFTRGERNGGLDALLGALARSVDPRDRAVAMQGRVSLGLTSVDTAWSDTDARVRRAAVLGALATLLRARDPSALAGKLLARLQSEADETTRRLLMVGLAGASAGDAGRVTTRALVESANAGGGDAPLAAFALARRSDERQDVSAGPGLEGEVDALLASRDPLLRASAARGLGLSTVPDATGRLAEAYAWEGDAHVRRALLEALARRTGAGDRDAAARRQALALAARLEPDRLGRAIAAAALAGEPHPDHAGTAGPPTVAWLRLVAADGAALNHDGVALLATDTGSAIPITFDDDGYALAPGVSPGAATVRLAPGLLSVTAMGR